MKCGKCGQEIKEGSKFCPKCGEKIANVNSQNVNHDKSNLSKELKEKSNGESKKRNKSIIATIAVVAVIAVVGLVALYIYVAKNNIKEDIKPEEQIVVEEVEAEVDYDNLVVDAYVWQYTNPQGEEIIFSVPKISLEGEEIDSLNKEIYDECKGYIDHSKELYENYGYSDQCNGIKYKWSTYNGILSFLIEFDSVCDEISSRTYNIRIEDKKLLTNKELFDIFGIKEDEYRRIAENVLTADIFDHTIDVNMGIKCYQDIVSQANVMDAPIYIDENGEIYFIVYVWYPENGTSMQVTLKYEDTGFTIPSGNQTSKETSTGTVEPKANSKEEICNIVAQHYNKSYETTDFVAYDSECTETSDGFEIILRSAGANTANILVDTIYVNTTTGKVHADMFDTEIWFYK